MRLPDILDFIIDYYKDGKFATGFSVVLMVMGCMGYIEGINNIFEMDFGKASGWIYTVNGESPSVGCANYKLSDGDETEWHYTCENGKDLDINFEK